MAHGSPIDSIGNQVVLITMHVIASTVLQSILEINASCQTLTITRRSDFDRHCKSGLVFCEIHDNLELTVGPYARRSHGLSIPLFCMLWFHECFLNIDNSIEKGAFYFLLATGHLKHLETWSTQERENHREGGEKA
jgi:hypothetical protein